MYINLGVASDIANHHTCYMELWSKIVTIPYGRREKRPLCTRHTRLSRGKYQYSGIMTRYDKYGQGVAPLVV